MTQLYKLINGSSDNTKGFEDAVGKAIEDGYAFSSRLIVKTVANGNDSKSLFFQPMVYGDFLDGLDDYDELSEE